jgi:hypothetical protein
MGLTRKNLFSGVKIMLEQKIENFICEALTGDAQKNALEFAEYLRSSEMLFERGKGYWADKLYWMIKYKDQYVCFILINGSEGKTEPWIVWSDDSGSSWFEDSPPEERLKEIALENVDFCTNCGGCGNPGGTRKAVFGKEFNNVCITAMKFINPDARTLECVKKMAELRKADILASLPK